MARTGEKPANSVKLYDVELIGWVKTVPKHTTVTVDDKAVDLLEWAFIKNGTFVNCRAWRGLAAHHAEFLKKDRLVRIKGTQDIDTYTKDGVEQTVYRVTADSIMYLDNPNAATAAPTEAAANVETLAEGDVF